MCALCGVLGGSGHWTDAAARPGVFTRNVDGLQRRRERGHRIACASRVLNYYGLTLSDWHASSYVLSAAIRELHSKRERGLVPRFRRLVVESTGLADPFPILSTVQADPVLRHHFRLGNVITTVDAVNGTTQLARQPECTKQVAVADRLVLTKTDLASAEATDALIARLRRLNPSAPLSHAAEAPLDAEALLSHDLFATAGRSEAARRWFAAEVTPRDDDTVD